MPVNSADDQQDEWTANPYSANNPKHHSHNEEKNKTTRATLNGRFGSRTDTKMLRTSDYTKEAHRPTGFTERSQSPGYSAADQQQQGKKVAVPPAPITTTEAPIPLEGATTATMIHGGATVWVGQKDGSIKIFNAGKFGQQGGSTTTTNGGNNEEEAASDEKRNQEETEGPATIKWPNQNDCEDSTIEVTAMIGVGSGVLVGRANGSVQCFDCHNAVLLWNKTPTEKKKKETQPKKDEESSKDQDEGEATEKPATANEEKKEEAEQWPAVTAFYLHPTEPLVISSSVGEKGQLSYWDVSQLLPSSDEDDLDGTRETDAEGDNDKPKDPREQANGKQMLKAEVGAEITAAALGPFAHPALFVGTTDGALLQLDLEDLGIIRSATLEVPTPKDGEDDGSEGKNKKKACIKAITSFDDTLAVAFEGSNSVALYSLIMPNFPLVAEFSEHSSPVVALSLDDRSGRINSLDSTGNLFQWDAKPSAPKVRAQIATGLSGEKVSSFMTRCAVDATRLWTTASSGINRVWWMEKSPADIESNDTIKKMNEMIAADEAEISDWSSRIETAHRIKEQRREAATSALSTMLGLDLMRECYSRLMKWRLKMQQIKRRLNCAIAMSPMGDRVLRSLYFSKLQRFSREQRAEKQRRNIASYILGCTDKGMQRIYFEKLHQFLLIQRRERNKRNIGELILRNTSRGLMLIGLRKWFKATDKGRYRRKREILASSMLRNSSLGLQKAYFLNWFKQLGQRKQEKKRNNVVETLMRTTEKGVQQLYFAKLKNFLRYMKAKRNRELWSLQLRANSDGALRADYFSAWSGFTAVRRNEKLRENVTAEEKRKEELEEDRKKIAVRLDKMKILKELQDQIKALKEEDEANKKKAAEIEENREQLEKQVAVKEERKEKDESLRDEFKNVMSTLKAKSVNFNTDLANVQKIVLQSSKSEPSKVFLSSHMEVKRMVIDITGEPTSPPKWNFGENGTQKEVQLALKKFPSHSHTAILNAIRSMVVAFDLMSQEEMDKLDTDEEIVANATAITVMFDTFSNAKKNPPKTTTVGGAKSSSGTAAGSKSASSPSKTSGTKTAGSPARAGSKPAGTRSTATKK